MEFGSAGRLSAIREVNTRTPVKFDRPVDKSGKPLKISDFFGANTFGLEQMKDSLPRGVYERLLAKIQSGQMLDLDTANSIAHAVKEWALEQGVTHFSHWFHPQTGTTAEKHDAFLSMMDDKSTLEQFSGSQLIQSEPDASSFPSGGMRTTFEARGYTVWDPSSPMFIMETVNGKTLCIPSAFISYFGDSLDEKTGLLRSMEVLSKNACELLHLLGDKDIQRVVPTLGIEQEYFLVDRLFFSLRPDLVMCERTLLGAEPPRGQQLEDHYFGSIPARVMAFMNEMECELYRLGVPVKTRHNEVAPSQFEMAPIFEEVNIATDHNHLAMEVLRKVARKHNFEALLHEKPFALLNGSGKHNNWSMMVAAGNSASKGANLLDPGKTPHQNLRFLAFLTAVMRGVHKHAGLLRAGIASPGNDHRLGANEAPPAIISIFLGETLSKILDHIERETELVHNPEKAMISLGVSNLPEIMKDNTDRNRTSPFAFTGNKFEFRAVGSSAATAFPMTLLNAAVADAISEVSTALRAELKTEKSVDAAVFKVLRKFIKDTNVIRFEGNNYSDEWVREAEKRGLLNLRKSPEALEQMVTESALSLLSGLGIYSKNELQSKYNIRVERYIKVLLIEAETMRSMVETMVLPAAYSYYGQLAESVSCAKNAGLTAPQTEMANKLSTLIQATQTKKARFESLLDKMEAIHDEHEKAKLISTDLSVAMEDLRTTCDELEESVADHFWPLPKYREMLFLSR